MTKTRFNLVFVILCFFTGIVGTRMIGQVFTSFSLLETLLFVLSPIYIVSKFFTGKTIQRYQDNEYRPSKKKRNLDDFLVRINIFGIQPICLDFLYASFLLLVVKWIAPDKLGRIANVIYDIYYFNKTYIKHPLSILMIIVGILTIVRILSHTYYKGLKKFKKIVSFPTKVLATCLLFINIDTGISSKYVYWKINEEIPKEQTGKWTFNDATQSDDHEIKTITEAYVHHMLNVLKESTNNTDTDSQVPAIYIESLQNISAGWHKDPDLRKDIYNGKAGEKTIYNDEEKIDVEDLLKSFQFEESKTSVFQNNTLFEDFHSAPPKNKASLFSALTDERTNINERNLTPNESILEELLSDLLGHTWFFKSLPDNINFFAFAKDKAFDILKDRLTEGLSFLFRKMKERIVTSHDVGIATDYIKTTSKETYLYALSRIRELKPIFIQFGRQYKEAIALKASMPINIGKSSASDLNRFVELFPNDINSKFYEKWIPLTNYKVTKDPENLKSVDFSYFKGEFLVGQNPKVKTEIIGVFNTLENQLDFHLASENKTAGGWELYISKYPNDPDKLKIEKIIANYRQKEEFDQAIKSGNLSSMEVFLQNHREFPHRHEMIAQIQELKGQQTLSQSSSLPIFDEFKLKYEYKLPPIEIHPAPEKGFFKDLELVFEHIRL